MPLSGDYIKARIDDARALIGRDVTFYTLKSDKCEDCVASGFYDPATDTSWNFVCPVCKGTGWSDSVDATSVLARVHWSGDERMAMSPGGKYYYGDCQLTIDPEYHGLAQQAMKDSGAILVDGRKVNVIAINSMGAPTVNRIRLICKATGLQPDAE